MRLFLLALLLLGIVGCEKTIKEAKASPPIRSALLQACFFGV